MNYSKLNSTPKKQIIFLEQDKIQNYSKILDLAIVIKKRNYNRSYYLKNKNKICKAKKKYYNNNKKYFNDYYHKNKDRYQQYHHDYYLKNKLI